MALERYADVINTTYVIDLVTVVCKLEHLVNIHGDLQYMGLYIVSFFYGREYYCVVMNSGRQEKPPRYQLFSGPPANTPPMAMDVHPLLLRQCTAHVTVPTTKLTVAAFDPPPPPHPTPPPQPPPPPPSPKYYLAAMLHCYFYIRMIWWLDEILFYLGIV